jgi:hypothetical protein
MNGQTNGQTGVLTNSRMNGQTDGQMGVWTNGHMCSDGWTDG